MSTDVQVIDLKELSKFGCRFGWYFYRSRYKGRFSLKREADSDAYDCQ